MGKPGAFLDIDRVTHELRPVEERATILIRCTWSSTTMRAVPRRAAA